MLCYTNFKMTEIKIQNGCLGQKGQIKNVYMKRNEKPNHCAKTTAMQNTEGYEK